MAKITRLAQLLFGSDAFAGSEIGVFGSLAAGAPAFAVDDSDIQDLPTRFTGGWFDAILGDSNPAIEDMNALFALAFRQLAYTLQTGVPEWNATTTYYIGSLVNDGLGNVYAAIQNGFTNQALTVVAYWRPITINLPVATDPLSGTVVLAVGGANKTYDVNTVNGAMQFTLPTASAGYSFTIKDVGGLAATYNITVARAAAESIEGVSASYACAANWGTWTFYSDGTNWFIR